MQQAAGYRYVKTEVERLSLWKGEDSWYRIDARPGVEGEAERPLLACHVVGNGLAGETTFHSSVGCEDRAPGGEGGSSREEAEVLFRVTPRRKLLNRIWDVGEGASGPPIASITLFRTRGLRVADPGDREQYRVVDPQGGLDRFMQTVLDGSCSAYAIVDDDRVIGRFERRERPASDAPDRRGWLGRMLGGLARSLVRNWCIELAEDGKLVADHRPLLAAFVLLQEQTIRLDQSISAE